MIGEIHGSPNKSLHTLILDKDLLQKSSAANQASFKTFIR